MPTINPPPSIASDPKLLSSWNTYIQMSTTTGAVIPSPKAKKTVSEKETPMVPLPPKKGFTFGCDPEGFIFKVGESTPIPAAGIIPGTKFRPHKINQGAVQVDGMAAEFNTDPASSYEEWEDNIASVISQLTKMLPAGYEIRWDAVAKFSPEIFDAAPDENKELGCQPDFDAWTGATNPPPRPENPYLRCAGGHLHIGWTEDEDMSDLQHLMNCQDFVKQLDWYLGGWSAKTDPDRVRRSLYGKMGAMRYKPYGVEYRVLSNFWVASKELRLEVWNRMLTAIEYMRDIYIPERANQNLTNMLRASIDKHVFSKDLDKYCEFPIATLNASRCRL